LIIIVHEYTCASFHNFLAVLGDVKLVALQLVGVADTNYLTLPASDYV